MKPKRKNTAKIFYLDDGSMCLFDCRHCEAKWDNTTDGSSIIVHTSGCTRPSGPEVSIILGDEATAKLVVPFVGTPIFDATGKVLIVVGPDEEAT